MSNTYLDKAIVAVPELGNRISLFTKKLSLAQYGFQSHLFIQQIITQFSILCSSMR